MIDPKQLRTLIVRPALEYINLWSQPAEDLVMGTAAQESRLRYVKQLGGGPALGLFQMEPATHNDIWDRYLRWKPEWSKNVLEVTTTRQASGFPRPEEMVWNLQYAAIMCRLHYVRKPGAIPITLTGQAMYWKKFYNTMLGKGTEFEFVNNYSLVRE